MVPYTVPYPQSVESSCRTGTYPIRDVRVGGEESIECGYCLYNRVSSLASEHDVQAMRCSCRRPKDVAGGLLCIITAVGRVLLPNWDVSKSRRSSWRRGIDRMQLQSRVGHPTYLCRLCDVAGGRRISAIGQQVLLLPNLDVSKSRRLSWRRGIDRLRLQREV